jgi:LysM repeat protein
MEFEDRNPKPKETNSQLPTIVLVVLISIICLLLYAGWNLMSDDASKISELNDNQATTITDSIPIPAEEIISQVEVDQQKTKSEVVVQEKKQVEVELGESATYVVKEGETFYAIANKFNIKADELKNYNSEIDPNGIKVGVTKLQIPIQGYHTVGPGDILRVVAEKYGVSVDAIMDANGKTKNFAQRGEKLVIPKK